MRRLALTLVLAAQPLHADPAAVEGVEMRPVGAAWSVSVTIRHGDTGWDDYADGWRVETAAGDILGTRTLHHPHVEEQPFTRSLSGVALPATIAEVYLRTRTNVTGWADIASGPYPVPRGR